MPTSIFRTISTLSAALRPKIKDTSGLQGLIFMVWPGSQMLDLRDHGPNICIEIGVAANRRRAEGYLYVLEAAFTVQRALCTFRGEGQPVQKATPVPRELPNLATNSLKFKLCHNLSQSGPGAPRGRIWSMLTKNWAQYTYRVRIDELGRGSGGEGAQGGGRGEESFKRSNTPEPRVGGFYVEFGSLWAPFWHPLAHFGLPLAHFWLTFGSLLVPFGSLLVPWVHFWRSWRSIFSLLVPPDIIFPTSFYNMDGVPLPKPARRHLHA